MATITQRAKESLTRQRSVNSLLAFVRKLSSYFHQSNEQQFPPFGNYRGNRFLFPLFLRMSTRVCFVTNFDAIITRRQGGWKNLTCSQNHRALSYPGLAPVQFHDDSRVIFSKAGERFMNGRDGRQKVSILKEQIDRYIVQLQG